MAVAFLMQTSSLLMLRGKFRQFESGQLLVHGFEADHIELGLDTKMTDGVFQL
ncbi:MAG: hypothetical protein ICV84_19270 [Flavisolibacter sp.]|nr:hypothetical protein [Flavisolibacter sp.]